MLRQTTLRRKRLGGFTLVELVIVVLVLGILASVAAPSYVAATNNFRTEAAAKRIAADLSYTRAHAIRVSQSRTVQFTVATNSYHLVNVPDIDRPSQNAMIFLSDTEYPATIVSATFSGSPNVTFDMHGKPSEAGTVVVQSGTTQRIVTLDADGGVQISP